MKVHYGDGEIEVKLLSSEELESCIVNYDNLSAVDSATKVKLELLGMAILRHDYKVVQKVQKNYYTQLLSLLWEASEKDFCTRSNSWNFFYGIANNSEYLKAHCKEDSIVFE